MLNPNDIEQLKGDFSREILIEKPVSLAIDDFKDGECKLLAPHETED